MRHSTIMPGSWEGQYIRLELIRVNDLPLPSGRIPAGIFVTINGDWKRRWKSAVRVPSSDDSEMLGDIVFLSLRDVPELSVEIRVSYELGRMLGSGEVVGKLEISWDELLDHGDEPFELSFPSVCDDHPSLTLQVAVIHPCDDYDGALFDCIVECEIARHTDVGHARLAEYMTSKTFSHLRDAVEQFQSVLDQCPVEHPDRAAALFNLASARLIGYFKKDLQAIDSSISLFREALALRPQGHLDHIISLYYLIEALTQRYLAEDTAVDLHESMQLSSRLLPLCPKGTCFHYIAAMANGVDIVMSDSIQFQRFGLELYSPGHTSRLSAVERLSLDLKTHFAQCGSIDDIDESIRLLREVVSQCPEGHPSRDTSLDTLASSLMSRFHHQGKSDDLNEAIALFEEALILRPDGHEYRHVSLDKLGTALRVHFDQHVGIYDISRVISLHREALTLCPPGYSDRDAMFNNLAVALVVKYDNWHISEDIDEAIDLYRKSHRLMRHDHPERHRSLLNLGSALYSRFTQTHMNEDVEEAIRLCQESLEALLPLHPDRHFSYFRLGKAYMARYRIQHDPTDLSLGVENFRMASGHPTQGFPGRILGAIYWVREAESYQHESALEAYHTYLNLVDDHLMTRSSTISRREAAIAFRTAQSFPVDAASCAIRRNDLRKAVELVEQGRGQQWSLASRLRIPLDDLESKNPILAHTFLELSKRLSDTQGSIVSTDRGVADQAETQYRKYMEQWKTAVAEIRKVDGFSRFLLPPLYEDLKAAARHGPVIIFIASQYSCNAIIVPSSGEPHHVPLPSITLTDLNDLKDRFTRAIRHASRMDPAVSRTDLIVLLRTIWDKIILPIVNVLKNVLKLQRYSRIWLCPTAVFTSIPLHAAGPLKKSRENPSGMEPCLEDLYNCSYTPTLSALIRSRQMLKKRISPSFVAIGQSKPGAGQGKELLTVDSELDLVRELFPATANPTTLSGDGATRAGALEALRQNTWVHLACHGKQDHEQPYNSHFAMRDAPLTLLDIMEQDIPHAEFAFLSACHTAVGDETTPDEVIHLAAGLQFSGFKSVIGTLWWSTTLLPNTSSRLSTRRFSRIWRMVVWWTVGRPRGRSTMPHTS